MITENFNISIDKGLISDMPQAYFHGNIVVIDKLQDVPNAVATLRKANLIGFDTETRPAFKKGQTHKVALLQLSTSSTCFLFRLNIIGFPQELIDLLADPSIKKLGASIHDDFLNLNKLQQFQPAGFIDVQKLVKAFHIVDNSLARIYAILFGQRISKGQRLTNWEAETLTPAQQQYAALDAYACICIYSYLLSGKFNPRTSPYIQPPQVAT